VTTQLDLNDFAVGTVVITARRTITDTDIISFAGLSGDFNALHVDDLFAKEVSPSGTRIAHGQLIGSVVTGLRSRLDDWPILSYLGAKRSFLSPVLAGDTIHGRYEVTECRPSKSRADRAIVILSVEVLNQNGDRVMSGTDTMLLGPGSLSEDRAGPIYLEDIPDNHSFGTSRRSLSEADIVSFCAITGDHSPLHTDLTFIAKETPFKEKIAQGWLALSIQSGLRSEIDRWRILAYLEAERNFRTPAYPGDTLEAKYQVTEIRRSKSKPDRGIVRLLCKVLNQNGEVVQDGYEAFLVATRPA